MFFSRSNVSPYAFSKEETKKNSTSFAAKPFKKEYDRILPLSEKIGEIILAKHDV